MAMSLNLRRIRTGGLAVLTAAALASSAGVARAAGIAGGDGPPTFTKDVAPILQAKCQVCHRPDGGAPFALMTFEQARPWARAIRQKVTSREMPPWHVDKTTGIAKYKEDMSLSDAEIATIAKWVDGGAPAGNPGDMPPARTFADPTKWGMGKPDLVISPAKGHEMPAKGGDQWIDFLVDVPLKEDRWIQAIEVRPGDPAIVHHLAVWAEAPGGAKAPAPVGDSSEPRSVGEGGSSLGDLLFTYAPGKGPDVYQPNTGYLLRAGTRIRMAAHYSADGRGGYDKSSVALKFYAPGKEPKYRVVADYIPVMGLLDIPANTVVTNDVFKRLSKPARVEAWSPHMHRRGKAATLEAILPNGTRQVLSYVDRYAFNWQLTYAFADDVAPLLPAGTLLHVITVHDNTAANRNNPDPNKWVGDGQGSNDEMAAAFVNYVYLDADDFDRQVAARRDTQRAAQASAR